MRRVLTAVALVVLAGAPSAASHDWKVPTRIGTQRVAIVGSLDYEPPPNP